MYWYKLDDFVFLDGNGVIVGINKIKHKRKAYHVTGMSVRYDYKGRKRVLDGIIWDGSGWIYDIESLKKTYLLKKHKVFSESKSKKKTLLDYATFMADDNTIIQQVALYDGKQQCGVIDYTCTLDPDDPHMVFILGNCNDDNDEFEVLRKSL